LRLLEVKSLKVYFKTQAGLVRAVDGVSLEIEKSEILGLVGESGSGKSTFGYAVMRLLPKNAVVTGEIFLEGEDLLKLPIEKMRKIRGEKIAMVFQGSMNSLNPIMRVEDQVAEPLIIHKGIDEEEAKRTARELLMQVGVNPEKAKSYPHELSGGLKQRVAIAMALALHPALLIADEPTTALDVMTQAQIMELLKTLRVEYNMSIIIISHDISLVSEVADRMAVMYAGKLAELGPTNEVVLKPVHPYTQGLIASVPKVDSFALKPASIPGDPPDPLNLPSGCRFMPRCSFARSGCESFDGTLFRVSRDHLAACLLAGERLHGRSVG